MGYREPHLQKKSDECANIWREWFDVKYRKQNLEESKELRRQWCQCCDEFSEMISQEVKTNPRYKEIELFPGKKKPPR